MQLVVNKQKNFSSFHNFQYESKGVRVWKACSIGKGKLVPYKEIFETHQGPTSMAVADNHTFFLRLVLLEAIKRNQQMKQKTMNCTNVLNRVAQKHSNPWKSWRRIWSLVIMKKLSNLKAFTKKYEGSGLAVLHHYC
jgi:hypothetical protein